MEATGDVKTFYSNSAPHITDRLEQKLTEDAIACTTAISNKELTLSTYLDELLDEKARLKKPDGQFKHIIRLINAGRLFGFAWHGVIEPVVGLGGLILNDNYLKTIETRHLT